MNKLTPLIHAQLLARVLSNNLYLVTGLVTLPKEMPAKDGDHFLLNVYPTGHLVLHPIQGGENVKPFSDHQSVADRLQSQSWNSFKPSQGTHVRLMEQFPDSNEYILYGCNQGSSFCGHDLKADHWFKSGPRGGFEMVDPPVPTLGSSADLVLREPVWERNNGETYALYPMTPAGQSKVSMVSMLQLAVALGEMDREDARYVALRSPTLLQYGQPTFDPDFMDFLRQMHDAGLVFPAGSMPKELVDIREEHIAKIVKGQADSRSSSLKM
ncbi:hypothetical protein ACKF11_13240 [Methylobacillus sp. Pita2]|uniref:hypothetical protein n=1 Tax=Methylobacillus sp. Pita2 TaxID=3383245 RepID=UPI0038B5E929